MMLTWDIMIKNYEQVKKPELPDDWNTKAQNTQTFFTLLHNLHRSGTINHLTGSSTICIQNEGVNWSIKQKLSKYKSSKQFPKNATKPPNWTRRFGNCSLNPLVRVLESGNCFTLQETSCLISYSSQMTVLEDHNVESRKNPVESTVPASFNAHRKNLLATTFPSFTLSTTGNSSALSTILTPH